jgi:protoporphyrinogen oxidase
MDSSRAAPVAIVGGGLAGLTAAVTLRHRGVPFVLFEASNRIAGLARSFHDEEGFTQDFGAHFITNRLAAAVGIGAHCRTVEYYGESVYLRGKTYSYPFGLLRNPRYVVSAAWDRFKRHTRRLSDRSADTWFRAQYGTALAEDVALPLLEAWSGVPAVELSAAVGEKMHGSMLQAFYLKSASRFTRRAVGSGYCNELPEHPGVWHVYPQGGVGRLCDALAEQVSDAMELESPVEAIEIEDDKVVGVRVNGRQRAAAAVISTAPCPVLAKLVHGTEVLHPLSQLQYRPMVFVNLRLRGRGLLKNTVVWVPEQEFPFFRLTETTRSMPWLAPPGKTQITVDLGCQVGDELWTMDDTVLGELCLEHLARLVPDIHDRYLGCFVLRTAYAYPVFLRSYEPLRRQLESMLGVRGLYSIGRNGEFSHALMEDVYWRTLHKTRLIADRWLAERRRAAPLLPR